MATPSDQDLDTLLQSFGNDTKMIGEFTKELESIEASDGIEAANQFTLEVMRQRQLAPSIDIAPQGPAGVAPQAPPPTEEEQSIERGRELVEERGLGGTSALIRGVGESALIGQTEEISATAQAALGRGDIVDIERQEEDISAALGEDFPGLTTIGELIGFATPGGAVSAIGKGVKATTGVIARTAPKLFGNITEAGLKKQFNKAFFRGASELGLFESTKELLETGDIEKAFGAGLFGAAAGGPGGVVGQKAAKFLQSKIKFSDAQKALALGLQLETMEREGGKGVAKLREVVAQMIGDARPEVLNSILRNPERIRELVKRGIIENRDIGIQIKNSVLNLRETLGKKIEVFKSKVRKSKKLTRRSKELKTVLNVSENELTSSSGASVLGPKEAALFDRVRKILAPEKINDADLLLVVESIDELKTQAAGNISAKAIRALELVRRKAKTRLRAKFSGWDKADANFVKFKENSDRFIRQIEKDPTRFVDTIFSKAKGEARRDVLRLKLLADKIDPSLRKQRRAVIREVFDVRAAQQVQRALTTPNRVQQQAIMNIVDKYRRRGAGIGATIGTMIGTKLGGPFVGAAPGGAAGFTIGQQVGEMIGQRVGNVDRIFKAAIRSKALGKQAKKIALDLKRLTDNGIKPTELFDLIPAGAKGVEELADFIVDETFAAPAPVNIEPLIEQSVQAAQ